MDFPIFERQLKYFKENREALLENYRNRHVVIAEEKVQADFAEEMEAIRYAAENFELGTFLVKLVVPENDEIVAHYYSPYFANVG